ncbi:MAG: protein tyrosine phosphatase, partial [Bacteroidia bacterium]
TEGINRISRFKQRTDKTGYIALIPDVQWLYDNHIAVPSALHPVLNQYWPGNLTVVFRVKDDRFDDISVNGKVAFRVPADNMLRHIIDFIDEPLISTSINISGVPPADNLQDIQKRYESWFDIGFIPQQTNNIEPSTIVEYIDTDENDKPVLPFLKCLRESLIPFYEVKQSFTKPTILFVCMGNICRSPIAEYLFNHYSKERNLPYKAKSAGLMETGAEISPNSMRLLAEKGIDSQEHYSRKINPEILNDSWLVLTMEEGQRDFIKRNFPEFEHKIYALKEYVGEDGDIADPIGTDIDYYTDIYHQIDAALQKLFLLLENKS